MEKKEINGKGGVINKITQNEIFSYLSGKNFKDENFPVASVLIKKNVREIIRVFYSFARTSDDIADSENLTSLKKLKILFKK